MSSMKSILAAKHGIQHGLAMVDGICWPIQKLAGTMLVELVFLIGDGCHTIHPYNTVHNLADMMVEIATSSIK